MTMGTPWMNSFTMEGKTDIYSSGSKDSKLMDPITRASTASTKPAITKK